MSEEGSSIQERSKVEFQTNITDSNMFFGNGEGGRKLAAIIAHTSEPSSTIAYPGRKLALEIKQNEQTNNWSMAINRWGMGRRRSVFVGMGVLEEGTDKVTFVNPMEDGTLSGVEITAKGVTEFDIAVDVSNLSERETLLMSAATRAKDMRKLQYQRPQQ